MAGESTSDVYLVHPKRITMRACSSETDTVVPVALTRALR